MLSSSQGTQVVKNKIVPGLQQIYQITFYPLIFYKHQVPSLLHSFQVPDTVLIFIRKKLRDCKVFILYTLL